MTRETKEKGDQLGTAERCKFTIARLKKLACPPNRQQVFYRDTQTGNLGVRVTQSGH